MNKIHLLLSICIVSSFTLSQCMRAGRFCVFNNTKKTVTVEPKSNYTYVERIDSNGASRKVLSLPVKITNKKNCFKLLPNQVRVLTFIPAEVFCCYDDEKIDSIKPMSYDFIAEIGTNEVVAWEGKNFDATMNRFKQEQKNKLKQTVKTNEPILPKKDLDKLKFSREKQ